MVVLSQTRRSNFKSTMLKSILTIIAALLKYGSARYSQQRSEGHGRNAAIAEAMKDVATILEDVSEAQRNALDRLRADPERVLMDNQFNRAKAKPSRTKPDAGTKG